MDDDLKQGLQKELAAAQTFSFDVERMKHEIGDEHDVIVQLIRAQLYLEHVITQTLTEAFRIPSLVDLRRLSFPTKLDFCCALGLYPGEWRHAVSKVNGMRNRVAHRLEADVSDERRRELWTLLPDVVKNSMRPESEESEPPRQEPDSFGNIFKAIIIWTDIFRQGAEKHRIRMKYAGLNAHRVLYGKEAREILSESEFDSRG